MKPFVSTLALLVIALGIGGYLWRERRNPALPPGSVALLSLDAASVRSIEVETEAQTLELQRSTRNAGWQVRSDGESAPADPERVRALLQSLQLVSSSAVGDLSRESDYGLVPPRATITVATSSGRTQLEFGNTSPVTAGQIYARVNGKVGVVSIAPIQNAVGDFESWRDRAVLRFDPQTVTHFTLVSSHLKVAFQKVNNGNQTAWHLTAPLQARADAGTVDTFLRALSAARFPGVSSTPRSPSEKSLSLMVSVQMPEATRTLKMVEEVSRHSPPRWIGQNAVNNAFVVPPPLLPLLTRPLFAWRETTVLPFLVGDITRIQIKYRGKNKLWQRDAAEWRDAQSGADEPIPIATREALLDLLLAAQNLRVTSFQPLSNTSSNPPLVVELGLDDQSLRITRDAGQLAVTSTALPDMGRIAPDGFAPLQTALQRLFPMAAVRAGKTVPKNTQKTSKDKP